MLCKTCKYWQPSSTRTKYLSGAHYESQLGLCQNPVVNNLVFTSVVPLEKVNQITVTVLKHETEFDESFGCDYHEIKDTDRPV